MNEGKYCFRCGKTKPATDEYFSRNKSKPDGWNNWCKVCMSEYDRARRDGYRERKNALQRDRRAANPDREKVYRSARSAAGREADRATSRRWKERNQARVRAYQQAYRQTNIERTRARKRSYRQANPERVRAWLNRRRVRKLQSEGAHTASDIQAQYARQKGRCYWCGEKVGDDFHVDHIVPLSRGGADWPDNLVIACPACNMSKHNKLPHEWIEGGRLL